MLILEKSTGSCRHPAQPPEIRSARNSCRNSLAPLLAAVTAALQPLLLEGVNDRIGRTPVPQKIQQYRPSFFSTSVFQDQPHMPTAFLNTNHPTSIHSRLRLLALFLQSGRNHTLPHSRSTSDCNSRMHGAHCASANTSIIAKTSAFPNQHFCYAAAFPLAGAAA